MKNSLITLKQRTADG